MSSLPAVWSVPAHLHLIITTHHDQYSARSRCLSQCPPYQLLEVSHHPSTLHLMVTQHITINIRPEAGVSLHVLLTSCWKCPSPPPPHGNNTSPQSIFGQNPVPLSKCPWPAHLSPSPSTLHFIITIHNTTLCNSFLSPSKWDSPCPLFSISAYHRHCQPGAWCHPSYPQFCC